MRNKKQNDMCDITRDFRPLSFCKLPHFLRLLPHMEREVLYPRQQIIYNAPFSDSEALST